MPTTIRFIGDVNNTVRVAEDAGEVAAALEAGAPLNAADGSGQVFVRPGAVACWYEGNAPAREDSGIASTMSPF